AVFRSPDLAAFTRELRKPESTQHLTGSALRAATAPPACQQQADATEAVAATEAPAAPSTDPAEPVASSDPPLPTSTDFVAGPAQPRAFALVVGVEPYKHASPAAGAASDAERFAALAQRTLGIPKDHVRLLLGEKADNLAFELAIEWLKKNVRPD